MRTPHISLIANTHLQLHRIPVRIDPSKRILKPVGFTERREVSGGKVSVMLEYIRYLPDLEIVASKRELAAEGYLSSSGKVVREGINPRTIRVLDQETDYYSINDPLRCLKDKLENNWIPIPYFKINAGGDTRFGPISWARLMIHRLPTTAEKGGDTHLMVLAFDTRVPNESQGKYQPAPSDLTGEDPEFTLCTNEDQLLNFCSQKYGCGWVEESIQKLGARRRPGDNFYLRHVAEYIYMLKYLAAMQVLPTVRLISDTKEEIEVDLVLDIGNSNTCGVLFEHPADRQSFEFTSVKMLQLQDFSRPELVHQDPFPMRLTFHKASFGDILIPEKRDVFRWPSAVRVGEEAERLGQEHVLYDDNRTETATSYSSPKRYLWDDSMNKIVWEFARTSSTATRETAYIEGITDQFRDDGSFAGTDLQGTLPRYSKKSLMTFVYIELLIQAFTQVNSSEFRESHGNPNRVRKIRRVTITSPTSIVQKEQVALREAAATAAKVLNRYFDGTFLSRLVEEEDFDLIEIVPRPTDLGKKLHMLDTRIDWIYDEATCCQLVFLYAELSKRFLNNCKAFFDLYAQNQEEQCLTVASIDIGGGTTDLMICRYSYDPHQSNAVLRPDPLYWDSYNVAGDDLLKNLVQQIVIEDIRTGENANRQLGNSGYGVIENHLRSLGCPKVAELLNNFFGKDNNRQSAYQRMLRKDFVTRFAIPIALRYLQHTLERKPDEQCSFEQLFPGQNESELLREVNALFSEYCQEPFRFQDISWTLSAARVDEILEETFSKLFIHLSLLISAYECDFLLLAGKPSTLTKIKEMFVEFLPVPPARIIGLNDYWVGRWYPFATDEGYFENPKSIVAAGALIALLGGRSNVLEGFRLDTSLLRTKLVSTADYIGPYDRFKSTIESIYFAPDTQQAKVGFDGAGAMIGFKQLAHPTCDGRPIFQIRFSEAWLREKAKRKLELQGGTDEVSQIRHERTRLLGRGPFTITIERDPMESKEDLKIVQIEDREQEIVATKAFDLTLCTLSDEHGYWLDTGQFTLNII